MDEEVHEFLWRHLNSILENDVPAYHATTHGDLTLYEWWVTPHRIDGLGFHDFLMESNAARGTVFGAEAEAAHPGSPNERASTRFDLSNLRIQRFGETAIASYTLLISSAHPGGTHVASHHETRVIVRFPEGWKVVHVHKSPAWKAPHEPDQQT